VRRRGRWGRWIAALLVILAVAAGAAMYRPDLPRPQVEAAYADARSKFTNVQGARIHYKDEGSGPPVLLIHGSGASLHTWEGWSPILTQGFRLIRVDLPGSGLSTDTPASDHSIAGYVAFVEEFRRTLGIERWAVGGNSVGGAVAWQYALAHGDQVGALVLLNSTGYPVERPLLWRLGGIPGLGQVLSVLTPRFVVEANLHDVYARPERVTPETVGRYHDLLLAEGNREALRRQMAMNTFEHWDELGRIQAPTLVMWGEQDQWLPVAYAERFHDDIPGSELAVVPDAGHIPMEERPEATGPIVLDFLARRYAP
jgi:pimeloyl-ACP methyl ester carboxylesterase